MKSHGGGLLLIPDISGFTEFVSSVEIEHSEHIISALLELLLEGNRLGLELSEIEGDALFFFRRGEPPTLAELSAQIHDWQTAFHTYLQRAERDVYCKCGACQSVGALGLKVVGHWGEFAAYTLTDKSKLIGKDVIVIHRMLKNSLHAKDYALLSRQLLARMAADAGAAGFTPFRQTYDVIGDVEMAYSDLSHIRRELPLPPSEDMPPHDVRVTCEIALPVAMADMVALVTDVAGWPHWIAGLQSIRIDPTEPLQPGYRQICVFPNAERELTVERIGADGPAFVMYDRIRPPPWLRSLHFLQRVVPDGAGSIYQGTFLYDRQPLLGRLLDVVMKARLGAQLCATAENLRRRFGTAHRDVTPA